MPELKYENAKTGIKNVAGERLFTHALKQSGNIAYAWIEAGKTLSIQRLNQVEKIGYAGIETS